TRVLVDLVSDRTGYPADMLGLDLDLEGDLGVDSIKRVEILASLSPYLPPALDAEIDARTETLVRARTLRELAAMLAALQPAAPVEAPHAASAKEPPPAMSAPGGGDGAVAAEAALPGADALDDASDESAAVPRYV